MKILRSLDSWPTDGRNGAVSIGNFDGVHRGHARLISRLQHWAQQSGGPSIVFTFDPHPVRILRPEETPPPLTWTERKAELLEALGVDLLVAYPASRELLSMSYIDFFEQIVVDGLQAAAMVEGPNFLFGKNRQGNVENLSSLCQQANMTLEVVEPLESGEAMVSSSRIRDLIRQGDLVQANQFLTQPYRVRGLVTHGDGRGSQIGFPTANIAGVDTLIPGHGVYAGFGYVNHERYAAAIHVGPNPTFGQQAAKIEAHLLDFSDSLYGDPLELEFHRNLRPVIKFDSVVELQSQIKQDIDELMRWSRSLPSPPTKGNQNSPVDPHPSADRSSHRRG